MVRRLFFIRFQLLAISLISIFFVTPALAGLPQGALLNPDVESPFVKVAESVRDSVVYIHGVHQKKTGDGYFFEPGSKGPSGGSGFVFRQEGDVAYILTNNHVIQNARTINVSLADRSEYSAQIKGADPKTDLAVLSIRTDKKLAQAIFGDSDQVKIGAWAVAIGNPIPHLEGRHLVNFHDRTVTVGIVSGKGRSQLDFGPQAETPFYQDYIQTDAPINSGNSGGPLFDIHGRVIGVNAAMTSIAGGSIGIGFAIPSNLAERVAKDILEHGRVIRAYLGFVPQDINGNIARAMGLDSSEGILVSKVADESPASDAGLQRGDIITQFDGRAVSDVTCIKMIVADSRIGQETDMEIIRDGKVMILHPVLREFPENDLLTPSSIPRTSNWLGIKVKEKGTQGVVIVGIEGYSQAESSDLRKGDVILEVEGEPVKDWNDYKAITKKYEDKDNVLFYLKRGKENLYIGVGK